ncbi:YihY/virulence factor BrkB family protein [Oceanibaculum sp.]|uniref:YihY/virulence factor BrkB family protein n=1 Tax=Oceanibaculum sp. TaxID=1903597 RepID=UPI002586E919|nr:YihY/virulence factor BrkB family protein [Oceanibaculum sp.]MCH2393639.1 YihY/virulence factor BrkB family protein [Oceanibaculum sp.]
MKEQSAQPKTWRDRPLFRRLQSISALPVDTARRFLQHDGMVRASAISFSSLFALFPFLIFLTAVAGALGNNAEALNFVSLSLANLPSEVADTLRPVITEVVGGNKGGILTLSMLATLWTAGSGVEALRDALNSAYDVEAPRSFLLRRLQGAIIVIAAALVILFTMSGVVFLPLLWEPLTSWLDLRDVSLFAVGTVQGVVAILLVLTGVTLLYRFLPNVPQRLADVVPGMLLAGLLWFALLFGFSWYLSSFGRFAVVYGSLGGIVITLLFFYLSAATLILGAELNAAIRIRRLARQSALAAAAREEEEDQ